MLAVAAGHLREVECSSAVQSGKVQEFVAFDQDEASLAVVARDYAHLGIQTMPGSVRQILSGKATLGQYDFVYAAGLFDYLSAPAAAALTCRMFDMTRPGGLMLIPNFLTGVRDVGYMEAFMDWHLIYRNHADMQNAGGGASARRGGGLPGLRRPRRCDHVPARIQSEVGIQGWWINAIAPDRALREARCSRIGCQVKTQRSCAD